MKKIRVLIAALILLLSLTGCGKYVSSYKAVGLIRSNEANSAFMNFYSFEGKMVFKLKSTGEGDIKYSAKLESGEVKVYYDSYNNKLELFSLSGGEEATSHGGYIEAGTVYVVIETDGKCMNGEFSFSVE